MRADMSFGPKEGPVGCDGRLSKETQALLAGATLLTPQGVAGEGVVLCCICYASRPRIASPLTLSTGMLKDVPMKARTKESLLNTGESTSIFEKFTAGDTRHRRLTSVLSRTPLSQHVGRASAVQQRGRRPWQRSSSSSRPSDPAFLFLGSGRETAPRRFPLRGTPPHDPLTCSQLWSCQVKQQFDDRRISLPAAAVSVNFHRLKYSATTPVAAPRRTTGRKTQEDLLRENPNIYQRPAYQAGPKCGRKRTWHLPTAAPPPLTPFDRGFACRGALG